MVLTLTAPTFHPPTCEEWNVVQLLYLSCCCCRGPDGPGHEEPGQAPGHAVRLRGAEHAAVCAQHLHPQLPEKHRTADQGHSGQSHTLPRERWVPSLTDTESVSKYYKCCAVFWHLIGRQTPDVLFKAACWDCIIVSPACETTGPHQCSPPALLFFCFCLSAKLTFP